MVQSTPRDRAADVWRSLLAKAVALPVGLLGSFATAWLTIRVLGAENYGAVATITGLVSLLSLADLGTGAMVVNTAIREEGRSLARVVAQAIRATYIVAAVGSLALGVGVLTGQLGWLLGPSVRAVPGAPAGLALSLGLYLLSLPLSWGRSVLQGRGRFWVVQLLSAPAAMFGLAWVVLSLSLSGGVALVAGSLGATALFTGVLSCWSAARFLPGGHSPWRMARRVRVNRRVLRASAPMFVISLSMAAGSQSDRLVLSWVTSTTDVAQYSLVSQLYAPVYALAAAGAGALWSHFGRLSMSAPREVSWSVTRWCLLLGGGALAVCLAIFAMRQTLSDILSSGEVNATTATWVAGLVATVVLVVQFVLGVAIADEEGLAFTSRLMLPMLVVNLTVSVLLAQRLGAAGPLVASALAYLMVLIVPELFYLRHRLSRQSRIEKPA